MLSSTTNMTCFQDVSTAKNVITLQMCGNGIVEPGEDCDPGVGKTSACCNPTTCTFLPNAVCDPASSDCCTDTCNFSPATQVCRPAADSLCDMPEMCTGANSTCPRDENTPNGETRHLSRMAYSKLTSHRDSLRRRSCLRTWTMYIS